MNIIIQNKLNEKEAQHFQDNPEDMAGAKIKDNKLYLCSDNKNIHIFAGTLDYPDAEVKGIKLNINTIKITL